MANLLNRIKIHRHTWHMYTVDSDEESDWESDCESDWEDSSESNSDFASEYSYEYDFCLDSEREKVRELNKEVIRYGNQLITELNEESPYKETAKLREELSKINNDISCLKDNDKKNKKRLSMLKKNVLAKIVKIEEIDIPYFNDMECKIKEELYRFDALASYFENCDSLIEYLESEFTSLFAPLNCRDEMVRSLFFSECYDKKFEPEKWDKLYLSLSDENYDGKVNELTIDQLKFLCIEFNIPSDGSKSDLKERLRYPMELYVPKNRRTFPLETFKTADAKWCRLMKENKNYIKEMFEHLGIDIPKGNKDELVRKLINHYYDIY